MEGFESTGNCAPSEVQTRKALDLSAICCQIRFIASASCK